VSVNVGICSWEGEEVFGLFNLYRNALALLHISLIGVVLLMD